jgi:hypothetical protein
MIKVTTTASKGTSLHTEAKTPCTHSRVVDYVLTPKGLKTGQLICLNARPCFPIPRLRKRPLNKRSGLRAVDLLCSRSAHKRRDGLPPTLLLCSPNAHARLIAFLN